MVNFMLRTGPHANRKEVVPGQPRVPERSDGWSQLTAGAPCLRLTAAHRALIKGETEAPGALADSGRGGRVIPLPFAFPIQGKLVKMFFPPAAFPYVSRVIPARCSRLRPGLGLKSHLSRPTPRPPSQEHFRIACAQSLASGV